jgi:acetylornithine deacetylase/succinyl-diaminopimelate desuccinylase-like protein
LVAWDIPLEVGPVVAGYYAAYAALDPEHARQFRQLGRALEDPSFRDWFMSDPAAAALVRDTLTPTVLRASPKANIVPGRAIAEIDSRLLPGHDCDDFLSDVRELIGSEHVRVEAGEVRFESSQSALDNELVAAVERVATQDVREAVVLPGLSAGFTDARYFRQRGIAAYGFVPLVVTAEERNAIHGPNERVRVAELRAAVGRTVALLEELAGPRS